MTIKIRARPDQRYSAIFDGNMTIYEAATDKFALLETLSRAKETDIDLSAVREMDTAGLQLLILAKRESLKSGTVLRLARHSAASLDVVERYGLAAYFARGTGGSAGKEPMVAAQSRSRKPRSKAKSRRRKSGP